MSGFDWASAALGQAAAKAPAVPSAGGYDWAAQAAALPPNTSQLLPKGMSSVSVLNTIQGGAPTPTHRAGLFGPKMTAFMAGGNAALPNGPLASTLGMYAFNKSANQAASNAIAAHPVLAGLGRATTSTALGALGADAVGAPLDAMLPIAKTAAGNLLRRSVLEAAEGAAFNATPTPEAGSSRMQNALTGFVLGGALPGSGILIKKGVGAAKHIMQPFTSSGRQALLGNALRDIAGGDAVNHGAPIPGMALTLGQTTENPGIQALEKGVLATPYGQTLYQGMRSANNEALLKQAQSIATRVDPDNLPQMSTEIADKLAAAKQAVHDRTAELYGAVDPQNAVRVSKKNLRSAVQASINSLGSVRSKFVPPEVMGLLDGLQPDMPFMQVKDLRSVVGNMARKAANNGDQNSAEAMGRVKNAITNYMHGLADKLRANPMYADTIKRWDDANDFAAKSAEVFKKNPLAGVFAKDASGAPRVEPESVGNRIFVPSRPSAVSQAQAALDMGSAPEGKGALQNWLVSKWFQNAATPQIDSAGNHLTSGARFSKFYRDNKPLFERAFPNESSRYVMKQMVKAAELSDRVQNFSGTGGSPTAMNLSTHRLIDELMGNTFSPTSYESGVGAGLLGDMALGPHAVIPAYLAGRIAPSVLKQMKRVPSERMQELLFKAIKEPQFGMQLMKRATPQTRSAFMRAVASFGVPVLRRAVSGAPVVASASTQ